jgi:hypothetical protein
MVSIYERYEVLTVITMKTSVFWDMTPCSLVDRHHNLRGNCCLNLQGGLLSSRFLQTVGTLHGNISVKIVTVLGIYWITQQGRFCRKCTNIWEQSAAFPIFILLASLRTTWKMCFLFYRESCLDIKLYISPCLIKLQALVLHGGGKYFYKMLALVHS